MKRILYALSLPIRMILSLPLLIGFIILSMTGRR